MNIIQFKTGTSDNDSKKTGLDVGELYINTNNQSLWIGKGSGQQFQIGCFDEVVTKIDSVAGSDPTKAKFVVHTKKADGTVPQPYEITAKIDGTVANATNAVWAQKIGTSSSHPSVGSDKKPVYVNSSGVVSVISPDNNIGSASKPVYYDKTSGFSPISSLNLTGAIRTTGALVCGIYSKVLATDAYGQIKSAGSKGGDSTPIWIEDGVFKECGSITASSATTALSIGKITTSGTGNTITTTNNAGIQFAQNISFASGKGITSYTVSVNDTSGTTAHTLSSDHVYVIQAAKSRNDSKPMTFVLVVTGSSSGVYYSTTSMHNEGTTTSFWQITYNAETHSIRLHQAGTNIPTVHEGYIYSYKQIG